LTDNPSAVLDIDTACVRLLRLSRALNRLRIYLFT